MSNEDKPPFPPTDETSPAATTRVVPKSQATNADVTLAMSKLRPRIPADADVQIKMRGDQLVVQTLDGKEFEPVIAGSAKNTAAAPPPAPTAIGQGGYDRILELLTKPPVDSVGLPPRKPGVPTDLKDWLKEFKEPLVMMTVESAISALQSKIGGYSRGRLKELYNEMKPEEIAAVMHSNAAVIKKFVDQKALEAGMIDSIAQKITDASASFLIHALSLI